MFRVFYDKDSKWMFLLMYAGLEGEHAQCKSTRKTLHRDPTDTKTLRWRHIVKLEANRRGFKMSSRV